MNLGGLEIFTVNRQIKTLEDWKGQLVAAISPAIANEVNKKYPYTQTIE